jgi:hypothetical protein
MFFQDIDTLKEFLEADKNKNDFTPVRYINVETLDMWVKLKSYLVDICSESLFLSNFCEQDDTTPNLAQMMSQLRKIGRNTLVLPLSEHLRVNNEIAKMTLEKILKANYQNDESNGRFRIYIPIYRMKSLLTDFCGGDKRYNNAILFIESSSDIDYALTIIQNNLDVRIAGNEIFGYKKYLSYWEQNPDKPIILHTGNAIHYANVVFADDVTVIVNAYQLLRYHYNLNEGIKVNWGTDNQWNELAKRFVAGHNIDITLLDILNATKFDQMAPLSNWRRYNSFQKWSLWLLLKIKVKLGYLYVVMNNSRSFEDFEAFIYYSITKLLTTVEYITLYLERKKIIKLMELTSLPGDFLDRLNLLSPLERIKCLTDNSDKEKRMILNHLQEVSINNSTLELLKVVYNDLYLYLQPTDIENELFNSYFRQYKICKVQDKYDDEFVSLVNEIGKNKGVWWELESRNYIVDKQYDDDTLIFYIDALGLEYIPILKGLLESRGISINVQVGYCNIPSITELNNDFTVNRKVEKEFELDKKKHEKAEYPLNLINEFDLIKKFAERAIRYLDENKKVIITSDHGSSRLAVLAKTKPIKSNDTATVFRHGRYCVDEKTSYGDDHSCCIDKDHFHIFANYDRFSISGAALGEIHGGATLEEVLVPVITIGKEKVTKKQISIEVLTPEIKQTPTSRIMVKFRINRKFDKVVAVVLGKRYECKYENDSWSFEPTVGKDEKYVATIVAKEKLGTFEYKIKKGISSNFDI